MKLAWLEQLESQVRPDALRALLGIVLLLIALGAYLYGIKPSLTRYQELSHGWSADALWTAEQSAAHTENEIAQLEQELQALEERLYGGPSRLPAEQIESHVIEQLDRLSASRDVQLVSVTPGESGEVLSFDELPFDVHMSGDYFALFEWLGAVERELRPMIVKRFEITPQARSERVNMKLLLVSYRPREETS